MRIVLEVEENGEISRTVGCEAGVGETGFSIAKRLADELEVEVEEILPDLGVGRDEPIERGAERRVRHRRVCVDLHFESEHAPHFFSPHARWRRVQRWGCRHFDVSREACANLELHDGQIDGPALNERVQIGTFDGCRPVWLVKPGAEPNG